MTNVQIWPILAASVTQSSVINSIIIISYAKVVISFTVKITRIKLCPKGFKCSSAFS